MIDTPSWLEGHVESLQIPALTTARYDCPVCGAKNTFSVTDDGLQRNGTASTQTVTSRVIRA